MILSNSGLETEGHNSMGVALRESYSLGSRYAWVLKELTLVHLTLRLLSSPALVPSVKDFTAYVPHLDPIYTCHFHDCWLASICQLLGFFVWGLCLDALSLCAGQARNTRELMSNTKTNTPQWLSVVSEEIPQHPCLLGKATLRYIFCTVFIPWLPRGMKPQFPTVIC